MEEGRRGRKDIGYAKQVIMLIIVMMLNERKSPVSMAALSPTERKIQSKKS